MRGTTAMGTEPLFPRRNPPQEPVPEYTATHTMDRQIARARREMGRARWEQLNADWETPA